MDAWLVWAGPGPERSAESDFLALCKDIDVDGDCGMQLGGNTTVEIFSSFFISVSLHDYKRC